jgi:alpha-1,2-mannosyltransferase
MKIIVACPTLNSLGGAERVCVFLMKILKRRNCNVTLITLDKTNWILLRKVFNETFRPDHEFCLLPTVLEIPTLTLRQAFIALSFPLQLFLATQKGGYDLLINMSGEIADSLGDLVYVNAMPLKLMHVYPQIQPTHGAQWGPYSKLYGLFTRFLRQPYNVTMTNSEFNRDIIRQHLGKEALVVYPPVDVQKIESTSRKASRENIAVTVSRFRSAKGLAIIPAIAARLRNCKFILIGTTDRNSKECLQEIWKKAKEFNVETSLQIFANEPSGFLLSKLSTAKVLLHTQAYEAFGMSVVEAMAAGCVPVVPRDGGPWFDILEKTEGVYGFSYGSVAEAAQKIRMLLDDDKLRTEVSTRASRRAMDFDSSIFERRILSIVERAYSNKLTRARAAKRWNASN